MENQKKTILVTGAAGFIGFHTSLALLKEGHIVVGYDNFNSYYSVDLKRRRAAILKKNGMEVIEGCLTDIEKLRRLFSNYDFTHLLHLAAQAGVRYSFTHPHAYVESNLSGFVSLMEIAKEKQRLKIVYASSSSVYGTNEKIPFSVEDRTDSPANLYAATKKANELMAFSYHHLSGLPFIGLRYFTVYGPWGRPDMACFLFTKAILEGTPITLFNNGKMERDFTYIDDVVSGTLAALDKEVPYAIYNIGNHQPVSLESLVSLLEEILGRKAKKTYSSETRGEVPLTFAEIEKSHRELGYCPKTSLRQGLQAFVTWYHDYSKSDGIPLAGCR